MKENRKAKKLSWESLSFSDKMRLFNKWSIISLIGNLCTMFGSITYLFPASFLFQTTESMLGLGCALNWISVTRYFSHSRQYSLITRTLQVAIPMNIKIMIGILPIFIGYILLGMSIFWAYVSHFSCFSDTAYCLFCMMNGDSILNTF